MEVHMRKVKVGIAGLGRLGNMFFLINLWGLQ